MIQTERQLNLSYERYVDRLHDEAYGEPDGYCHKCDAPVAWWSDYDFSGFDCEECGYEFHV